MNSMLVDASFLIALSYPRDKNHEKAKGFTLKNKSPLLIPDVVLPEVMYNLRRIGGLPAVLRFAEGLLLSPPFVALTATDFTRAMAVMKLYRSAELDFVDCCLTALAERLNIIQICTFDYRDFSMIRPQHTDYFVLFPN